MLQGVMVTEYGGEGVYIGWSVVVAVREVVSYERVRWYVEGWGLPVGVVRAGRAAAFTAGSFLGRWSCMVGFDGQVWLGVACMVAGPVGVVHVWCLVGVVVTEAGC